MPIVVKNQPDYGAAADYMLEGSRARTRRANIQDALRRKLAYDQMLNSRQAQREQLAFQAERDIWAAGIDDRRAAQSAEAQQQAVLQDHLLKKDLLDYQAGISQRAAESEAALAPARQSAELEAYRRKAEIDQGMKVEAERITIAAGDVQAGRAQWTPQQTARLRELDGLISAPNPDGRLTPAQVEEIVAEADRERRSILANPVPSLTPPMSPQEEMESNVLRKDGMIYFRQPDGKVDIRPDPAVISPDEINKIIEGMTKFDENGNAIMPSPEEVNARVGLIAGIRSRLAGGEEIPLPPSLQGGGVPGMPAAPPAAPMPSVPMETPPGGPPAATGPAAAAPAAGATDKPPLDPNSMESVAQHFPEGNPIYEALRAHNEGQVKVLPKNASDWQVGELYYANVDGVPGIYRWTHRGEMELRYATAIPEGFAPPAVPEDSPRGMLNKLDIEKMQKEYKDPQLYDSTRQPDYRFTDNKTELPPIPSQEDDPGVSEEDRDLVYSVAGPDDSGPASRIADDFASLASAALNSGVLDRPMEWLVSAEDAMFGEGAGGTYEGAGQPEKLALARSYARSHRNPDGTQATPLSAEEIQANVDQDGRLNPGSSLRGSFIFYDKKSKDLYFIKAAQEGPIGENRYRLVANKVIRGIDLEGRALPKTDEGPSWAARDPMGPLDKHWTESFATGRVDVKTRPDGTGTAVNPERVSAARELLAKQVPRSPRSLMSAGEQLDRQEVEGIPRSPSGFFIANVDGVSSIAKLDGYGRVVVVMRLKR